jgi:hypothetical protein
MLYSIFQLFASVSTSAERALTKLKVVETNLDLPCLMTHFSLLLVLAPKNDLLCTPDNSEVINRFVYMPTI